MVAITSRGWLATRQSGRLGGRIGGSRRCKDSAHRVVGDCLDGQTVGHEGIARALEGHVMRAGIDADYQRCESERPAIESNFRGPTASLDPNVSRIVRVAKGQERPGGDALEYSLRPSRMWCRRAPE